MILKVQNTKGWRKEYGVKAGLLDLKAEWRAGGVLIRGQRDAEVLCVVPLDGLPREFCFGEEVLAAIDAVRNGLSDIDPAQMRRRLRLLTAQGRIRANLKDLVDGG